MKPTVKYRRKWTAAFPGPACTSRTTLVLGNMMLTQSTIRGCSWHGLEQQKTTHLEKEPNLTDALLLVNFLPSPLPMRAMARFRLPSVYCASNADCEQAAAGHGPQRVLSSLQMHQVHDAFAMTAAGSKPVQISASGALLCQLRRAPGAAAIGRAALGPCLEGHSPRLVARHARCLTSAGSRTAVL